MLIFRQASQLCRDVLWLLHAFHQILDPSAAAADLLSPPKGVRLLANSVANDLGYRVLHCRRHCRASTV